MSNGIASGVPPAAGGAGGAAGGGVCARADEPSAATAQSATIIETSGRMVSPPVEVSCGDRGHGTPRACRRSLVVARLPLFPEMLVEERGDFLKRLFRLRRGVVAIVMGVRLAFENLQRGLDAGLAQLAMNAHGVAEQQVPGA